MYHVAGPGEARLSSPSSSSGGASAKIESASSAASLLTVEAGGWAAAGNNCTPSAGSSSAASASAFSAARQEMKRRNGERFNGRRAPQEDWEIGYDKVIFKEQIGNGSFGTVYKAYYFGECFRPESVKFCLFPVQVRWPSRS